MIDKQSNKPSGFGRSIYSDGECFDDKIYKLGNTNKYLKTLQKCHGWMEGPAFSQSTVQNILPIIRRFLSVAKLSYSALFFARYRSSIFVKKMRYCNTLFPQIWVCSIFSEFQQTTQTMFTFINFFGYIVDFTVNCSIFVRSYMKGLV